MNEISIDARVSLIEAAGDVGEARLVARQLRTWIAEGIEPVNIIVTTRDLVAKELLLREVFDEYAVPTLWSMAEPVARCGAVALLRRVWPLALKGFPFRQVAAIWRNNYFRPTFDPDLPLKAESLLRQLDVPRGKAAILDALMESAEDRRPLPLEDETMERSQRDERSQLAKRCLGFYQWFFGLWSAIPDQVPPAAFVKELRRFAKELGVTKTPLPGTDDATAMTAFGAALDEWVNATGDILVTPADFERAVADIAAATPWPKPKSDSGVRIMPVDATLKTECTHMILLGLGEGSFPQLGSASIEQFEAKGAEERTLFKNLLTKPTQAMVLSYPALNERGQELLPSSFLADIKANFPTIPTTTQTMLIDGYLTWAAISEAERRAQFALEPTSQTKVSCAANLFAAKKMADARFISNETNPYSGVLANDAVIAAIAKQFGSDNVFSPTSLETYIACPFRFFLEKALKLEEAAEPTEEVEVSRRGMAIHRALARFHSTKPHERPEAVVNELDANWAAAVAESADRTPSQAGKVLWQLERRRVQRSLNRYPAQWDGFRSGWKKHGATPTPSEFEAMFGYAPKPESKPPLAIDVNGVPVRIGGIIDRVDLAELDDGFGFWIIDYKTGSGTAFRAKDVLAFEKLQLPLYALAVERIFEADRKVRPLGLAYWLIVKDGPKAMLPETRQQFSWADDADAWPKYRREMERVVVRVATSLRSGDFRLAPRRKETCNYCQYSTVCRINQQRGRFTPLPLVDGDA